MNAIKNLHQTLNQRKRPEDVAQMIFELLEDELSFSEKQILEKATKHSLKNIFFGYTSMAQEFGTAISAEKQIRKTMELFKMQSTNDFDYENIDAVQELIEETSHVIHKAVGANNFLTDRLTKEQRQEKGLDMSKRSYNKKWRILKRLEKKLLNYQKETKKIEFQKVGKHGLAHTIDFHEFQKDLNTACFIAYYNATCNRRSIFTNQRQPRPFDEIAEMLLNRCRGIRSYSILRTLKKKTNHVAHVSTNWWVISHIYPSQEVLSHLTEEQKGKLLGTWTQVLQDIACCLEELWENNEIDRRTMIVRRGNDSTTWNHMAGAWNKARDTWMNVIYALGMEDLLDTVCFGKVLRLMASDVVAWHHHSGSTLDPNTHVWNQLPLPWEVFQGQQECTRTHVQNYCKNVGIDPEKSGWIAPRIHKIANFTPTPELVHGVMVANPYLASVLKKQGYFSGK